MKRIICIVLFGLTLFYCNEKEEAKIEMESNKLSVKNFSMETLLTNIYVDNTASGENNGTSWENAYESFDDINWANVDPTDTIFISGGSTSKTYNETLTIGRSGQDSTHRLVVTKGYSTGHDGEVIIDGDLARVCVRVRDYNYISIEGLTAKDGVGNISDACISVGYSANSLSHIDLIGCIIINPSGLGIKYLRTSHIKIQNNYISSGVTVGTYDTDGIYLDGAGGSYGNAIISGNVYINQDNQTDSNFHIDGIQTSGGWGGIGTTKIYNNFIGHFPTAYNGHHSGMMLNTNGRFEIYNNIIVSKDSSGIGGNWGIYVSDQGNTSRRLYFKVYNNTVVMHKVNAIYTYRMTDIDSLWFYNNISYGGTYGLILGTEPTYRVVDNNQYYNWNNANIRYLGTSHTLTAWQAVSGTTDENGHNSSFTFDNIWGTTAVDYKILSGTDIINKGATLTLFNTDYTGTSRPQGAAWDKGAYEYF